MLRQIFLLASVLTAVCYASSAYAQDKRGPSTAEERKRAVEMATFLEKNPLAKEAKDLRAALLFFLAEVPDIHIKICIGALGPLKRFKGDYDSELLGQLTYSQAKFIFSPRWILHPQPIGLDGEEIETACELKGLSLRRACGLLVAYSALKC